ncbi:MAG: hypothetical protein RLZZ299_179 [Pseudomonadota bacterium]|jgi:transcriptional regulator with XRE-family HTH domain
MTPSALLHGNQFGLRLRSLREARGLTQERLAWDSGHAKSYVCEIEAGRKLPSLEVLGDLAQALGVRPWELLLAPGESPKESPTPPRS